MVCLETSSHIPETTVLTFAGLDFPRALNFLLFSHRDNLQKYFLQVDSFWKILLFMSSPLIFTPRSNK